MGRGDWPASNPGRFVLGKYPLHRPTLANNIERVAGSNIVRGYYIYEAVRLERWERLV